MTTVADVVSFPEIRDVNLVRYRFSCSELDDAFVVTSFSGVEELNRPYQLRVQLAAELEGTECSALLGRDVTLTLERGTIYERAFSGIVERVIVHDNRKVLETATAVVVPALAGLRFTRNTRIYQGMTALSIVEDVLTRGLAPRSRTFEVEHVDASRFAVRDYCVQYQETDLDFVHRLLEEEGVGYYFRHEGPEKLVLFDDNRAFLAAATMDHGPVRYEPSIRNWVGVEPIVLFAASLKETSSRVVVRDHDWTRARGDVIERSVEVSEPSSPREVYEHGAEHHLVIHENGELASTMLSALSRVMLPAGMPAGLEHMVHDLGGAVFESFSTSNAEDRGRIRGQQLGRDARTCSGVSVVTSFSPGRRFELIGHPTLGADGEYYITRQVHSSERPTADSGDEPAIEGFASNYHNRVECLPLTVPWRPDPVTQKPRVHGIQTAEVTGPVGMNVYTDPFGRIRVRFPWDRAGEDLAGNYTCWIRVSQAWAGDGAPGFMFIPRVGMEVVVSFIDGDPDRPLVTGCVYNGQNPTPGFLPLQATKSIIRTRTVPHGAGYNELSFEDAMGMERVHLRAERDLDELINNNHQTRVGRTQRVVVGGDQYTTVEGAQQVSVRGAQRVSVLGRHNVTSLTDFHHTINGSGTVVAEENYDLTVEGGTLHLSVQEGECVVKSKGPLTLEQNKERYIHMTADGDEKGVFIACKESTVQISDDKIELKIGGSSILMTSAGIQINGKSFPASGGGEAT